MSVHKGLFYNTQQNRRKLLYGRMSEGDGMVAGGSQWDKVARSVSRRKSQGHGS